MSVPTSALEERSRRILHRNDPATVRLGRVARIFYGASTPPPPHPDGIPLVRATDVHDGRIAMAGIIRVASEARPGQRQVRLKAGDIIVVRSGAYTGDSAIVPPALEGALAGYDMVVRATDADPRYVAWHLLAPHIRDGYFGALRARAAQPHLNAEELAATPLYLPDREAQRLLAEWLDRECVRIDEMLDEQERLALLLDEERRAIIQAFVARGLVPNAELRPSGVPWLGSVPSHWRVARIKTAAKLETGHTPSRQHPEYWLDCTIPWFTLGDVWQLRDGRQEYIGETAEHISELGMANSAARLLPAGTVVLSRTASVGFTGIMSRPMATSQDFANWVPTAEVVPEYLLFVLRAMRPEFERLMFGSTHKTIYMPDIAELRIPLPPLPEQHAIVAAIRGTLASSDAAATEVARVASLLREYRSGLITAAVTGQLGLRRGG